MTQPKKTVRKREDAYEDLVFAGWSRTGWVESVAKFLRGSDHCKAIGSLTLIVIAFVLMIAARIVTARFTRYSR